MHCPICKNKVSKREIFCLHCRYPVGVKKISNFNSVEQQACLSGIISLINNNRGKLFKDKEGECERFYHELFSLHWLRPEAALFKYVQMSTLGKLRNKYLRYPIIDLGCGDGLFTSVLFGARINKSFDAYGGLDFKKSDIFDTHKKLADNFFIRRPLPIGSAVDIKPNMARKARDLNVYDEVRLSDIRELPFKDGVFNAAFSNMISDIRKEYLDAVFNSVNRVIKTGGYFVFTTPIAGFKKGLVFYNKAAYFRKKKDFGNLRIFDCLDRGRSLWEERPLGMWKKICSNTSFNIVEYREYCSTDTLRMWDVGFRPFLYQLTRIKKILIENNVMLPVKELWVDMAKEYFFKYIKDGPSQKNTFAVLVARKL